jgi:peptidoglycan/xylan/chitin deacetylase (PgdA/CDA1 family)
MKKAWYILNYHNISWEENRLLRPIGGSFSPDLFEEHIIALQEHFDIVGVNEGYAGFSQGKIQKPLLSIWFDDGLAGCSTYAEPILSHYGHKAAMSVNSSFTLGKEVYWRMQLAWLNSEGLLPMLKNSLKAAGYIIPPQTSLREFTLGEFDTNLRTIINQCFIAHASPRVILAAHKLFDSVRNLQNLKAKGWVMANHTASHFPVSEKKSLPLFLSQFQECELELESMFGTGSQFWVLPFDRKPDPELHAIFENSAFSKSHVLVHVGNAINNNGADPRYLYRLFVPDIRGNELVHYLKQF